MPLAMLRGSVRMRWQRLHLAVVCVVIMAELYKTTCCTCKSLSYDVHMDAISDDMPISEARANLTEVVNAVRLQDRAIRLSRRGTPQAAVVPVDLLDLIDAAGGLDAARKALSKPA